MSGEETAAGVDVVVSQRPGRLLAETRATRNLSVAEVAQQLKLSASQVDALEADAYERLPGPVFVRGFVRNYARLLELDADALVQAVDLPHAAVSASAAVPVSREIPFPQHHPTRWWPYALGLTLLVGVVVLFELFFSAPPTMMVSAVSPQAEVVPVAAMPAQPAAVAAEPAQPAPVLPEAAATSTAPMPESATQPQPTAAQVPAQSEQQQSGATAELHFVFETSSWVEVRDRNNRILLSQLNPAGTEQHVQGRLPLSLVVGNARGVSMTRNGQPFDLAPHTRVEVARFTLE